MTPSRGKGSGADESCVETLKSQLTTNFPARNGCGAA